MAEMEVSFSVSRFKVKRARLTTLSPTAPLALWCCPSLSAAGWAPGLHAGGCWGPSWAGEASTGLSQPHNELQSWDGPSGVSQAGVRGWAFVSPHGPEWMWLPKARQLFSRGHFQRELMAEGCLPASGAMSPSVLQCGLGGEHGIYLSTVSTKVLNTECIPASRKEREERKLTPWPLRIQLRSCRHHLYPNPLART